jgi:hypothetical protein
MKQSFDSAHILSYGVPFEKYINDEGEIFVSSWISDLVVVRLDDISSMSDDALESQEYLKLWQENLFKVLDDEIKPIAAIKKRYADIFDY